MKLPIATQPAHDWSADKHGMAYDNPQFWDAKNLGTELHRVFEICNGCRLCFNLCPSFDVLFKRIDALDPHAAEAEGMHLGGKEMVEEHDAAKALAHVEVSTESPVSLLQAADNQRVIDLCYECKLCYPKCPYVPPHEFAVDFPKLMLRAKMIRTNFPDAIVVARARNVQHYYELYELGVTLIERETLDSALMSARSVLEQMGWQPHQARNLALRFRRHNVAQLAEIAPHRKDEARLIAAAKQGRRQLEELFAIEREQAAERQARAGWSGTAEP